MMVLTVTLIGLAAAAIVASVRNLASDGYRRVRSAGIRRDGHPQHWH